MGLYTRETRFHNISTIQSELVCLLLTRFMVRTFIKRILDPWCQNKCFGIYIVIHMFQMHKIQKGEIQQKVNKMLNIVDQKYLKILLCSKSYPKKHKFWQYTNTHILAVRSTVSQHDFIVLTNTTIYKNLSIHVSNSTDCIYF